MLWRDGKGVGILPMAAITKKELEKVTFQVLADGF